MASIYVDSTAAGAGTGADWANAYTTLNAAFTGGAAGDTFWVAHDHAETAASATTITAKGTSASPCRVICVDSAGTVPPVSADLRTTATITTTGANALSINGTAVCYFEGIIFRSGTGAVTSALSLANSNDSIFIFKNCAFKKLGTSNNASAMAIGGTRSRVECINCTMEFGNAGDGCAPNGLFIWRDTPSALVTTVLTTGLFNPGSSANFFIEGVDLSLLTPGTSALVRAMGTGGSQAITFKDCKLGASVVPATVPTIIGPTVSLIRCDSGDTNYRSERYNYQGTLTTETTTVRSGGASDGTTPIAWKIVPTANNEALFPFECFPISVWNETTGSAVTLTIEGTWGGGAVPTTADIWMEVEYLGTSGNPLGDTIYGGVANTLAAGVAHTSSSETWGAGGTTKFKMAVSVTPQEKGPITVYVKYAGVTNTVWIDPLITVS